jgi:uncharacterized protein DUF5719
MNRLVFPAAASVAVALAVLGASALPVQQPTPDPAPDDDRARVAVVCPTVTDNPTGVAAFSPGDQVQAAPLADPGSPVNDPATAYADQGASAPLVVSAPRRDPFSATTRTTVADGSDRGLSLASCERPGSTAWFAGVNSSETGTAEVVLLNADAADATVDLTVYGSAGRVSSPGSRGIVVPAHSRRVVPLGPLFAAEQAVSLQVSTSAGRVAATVRQRVRDTDGRPAGSDWLPPTAAPATAVVIPGLPHGKGARDLVVVNPGERTASVALQVLGADGPIAVPGLETIDLPPQTSRLIGLAGPLAEAPVGLRLSSEQKITAGVISGNGADAATADISAQVATPALTGPAVLALSPGQRLAPVLHLTGGIAEPGRVRVVVRTPGGKQLLARTVDVPGFADATVRLPRATDVLIELEPQAPAAVHASVAVRNETGDGVGSAAVLPGVAATSLPPIRQDPRLGG